MNKPVISWLLEDENPAVKYRTQTEILGENADRKEVIDWIFGKFPADWHETKGLWYSYYVTALAECGLRAENISVAHIQRALELPQAFDGGCATFLLLRALIKLGFADVAKQVLVMLDEHALPDDGFVCARIKNKLKYTPKSCYKANVYALFCAAECKKAGIAFPNEDKLLDYFFKRNIFYRCDNPEALIMDGREGWRIVDTFHPFEPMRVGIHNIVEAFSALGYGNDERLAEAWELLNKQTNEDEKVILSQTLTKSYLPKETKSKPSKWVTFYRELAKKECGA